MVNAVEEATPLYESISENISFNLAGPLRRRAIDWLTPYKSDWVLDSGTGPGVSSRLLLSHGFPNIVGLDPSVKLLKYATSKLGDGIHPIVGASEHLPFKSHAFGSVLTCFALRDVRDLESSLREFGRAVRTGGGLAVVDVGKPDSLFLREMIGVYIRWGMPLLARLLIRNRLKGNPFRMIVPTFHRLLPNRRLAGLLEREFGPSRLREFMMGGLVVITAIREAARDGSGQT